MTTISEISDALAGILTISDDGLFAEELQLQELLEASILPSSCCQICTDEKHISQMFKMNGCDHSYCSDCISKYIESKLQNNIIHIPCPDHNCSNAAIKPTDFRSVLPLETVGRWEEAMIQSTFLESERIYCPYENCSEMMVDDGGGGITESECPRCRRLFCARCKVAWHSGVDCEEYRSGRGKEQLSDLAGEKKWKQCPNCKLFVEKTDGCIHITCWCKFEFCYICGLEWDANHFVTCDA